MILKSGLMSLKKSIIDQCLLLEAFLSQVNYHDCNGANLLEKNAQLIEKVGVAYKIRLYSP